MPWSFSGWDWYNQKGISTASSCQYHVNFVADIKGSLDQKFVNKDDWQLM